MRRRVLLSLILVLALSAAVRALSLCEYRSPRTDLSSLVLSFAYQYHNDPNGIENYDVNSGLFGTEYVRLVDRPEFGYDLEFQNELYISTVDISSTSTMAVGNYKRYFSSERADFAFAGATARSSSSFDAVGLSFNLGLGRGRFTDVTPMAKAVRINDRLVRNGSLKASLHPADQLVIARDIGSIASYPSVADLLDAVVDVIEASNLTRSGGLDALDISEILRLIEEKGVRRYCGWDLKFGLGYALLDPARAGDSLLMTGAFNYAFTRSPEAQLLIQGSLSAPVDFTERNRIDVAVVYDFLVAEFLNLSTEYKFSRETWPAKATDIHRLSVDLLVTPVDTASVVIGVELEHRTGFVEWRVDVKLSMQMALL